MLAPHLDVVKLLRAGSTLEEDAEDDDDEEDVEDVYDEESSEEEESDEEEEDDDEEVDEVEVEEVTTVIEYDEPLSPPPGLQMGALLVSCCYHVE